MLSRLCQKAGKRLRDSGLDSRTVTLTIRYARLPDHHARENAARCPPILDPLFLDTAAASFRSGALGSPSHAVRLIGVGKRYTLTTAPASCRCSMAPKRDKLARLAHATNKLRDRFGFSKIQLGGSLGSDGDH